MSKTFEDYHPSAAGEVKSILTLGSLVQRVHENDPSQTADGAVGFLVMVIERTGIQL